MGNTIFTKFNGKFGKEHILPVNSQHPIHVQILYFELMMLIFINISFFRRNCNIKNIVCILIWYKLAATAVDFFSLSATPNFDYISGILVSN